MSVHLSRRKVFSPLLLLLSIRMLQRQRALTGHFIRYTLPLCWPQPVLFEWLGLTSDINKAFSSTQHFGAVCAVKKLLRRGGWAALCQTLPAARLAPATVFLTLKVTTHLSLLFSSLPPPRECHWVAATWLAESSVSEWPFRRSRWVRVKHVEVVISLAEMQHLGQINNLRLRCSADRNIVS